MFDEVALELPMLSTPVPLHISWDPIFRDLVSAAAYGVVVDEWHGERLRTDAGLDYLVHDGIAVGFEVFDLSGFELDMEDEDVWDGPRFSVPVLGLDDTTAGQIIASAWVRWGETPSNDVVAFQNAVEASELRRLERARFLWEDVIEAGDLKGIFGLGYTLYDLGRYRDAYKHLRRYTELAPANAWVWCWYGKACAALGSQTEAAAAYRMAIDLEDAGGLETDAPELLEELEQVGER